MRCRIALGRWAAVTRAVRAALSNSSRRGGATIQRAGAVVLRRDRLFGARQRLGTARRRGPAVEQRYGLVLGKVTALVALGVFGWWHRRRSRSFLRLAAGEVVVMAATVGLPSRCRVRRHPFRMCRRPTSRPRTRCWASTCRRTRWGRSSRAGGQTLSCCLPRDSACPVRHRRTNAVEARTALADRAHSRLAGRTRRRHVRARQRAGGIRPGTVQRTCCSTWR